MPIYEYRCKACGQTFDKLSSISEKDDMKTCPYCGKDDSVKLVSGFLSKSTSKGSCNASSGG
ncbi:MAG TPA: zinc ribbon domain-containing protein [Clostridia bacterium]|nr:zinc ribbon domain-containing protein [Clostridia bacterium]